MDWPLLILYVLGMIPVSDVFDGVISEGEYSFEDNKGLWVATILLWPLVAILSLIRTILRAARSHLSK